MLKFRRRMRACFPVACFLLGMAPIGTARGVERANCAVDVRAPVCVRALDLHDEAQALYAQGRYRDAIGRLDEAVMSDPNGGQLYFNLGKIHELLGDLEPALRNYRRALDLETNVSERERLQAMVKRLQGAQSAHDRESASALPPQGLALAPVPRLAHRLRPWFWASSGAAVGFGALGGALAGYAAVTSPGSVASTNAETTIDALQAAAERAKASAVAADVFMSLASLSALASISIGFLMAEPEAADTLIDRPAGVQRAAALSLDVGASSLSLRWRFQ